MIKEMLFTYSLNELEGAYLKEKEKFPQSLTSQFPEKRGTGFPKCDQVNFPETGSEFREIGVFLGNQVIFL